MHLPGSDTVGLPQIKIFLKGALCLQIPVFLVLRYKEKKKNIKNLELVLNCTGEEQINTWFGYDLPMS